jgi:hypothetical protein
MLQRPFIILGLIVVGLIVFSGFGLGFVRRMSGKGPTPRKKRPSRYMP